MYQRMVERTGDPGSEEAVVRHHATQELFQDERVRKIRFRKDRPCAVCGAFPTVLIRERIPGSKGNMAQSFAGSYRLCQNCVARAERMMAVTNVDSANKKREERITVLAKTFALLKGIQK